MIKSCHYRNIRFAYYEDCRLQLECWKDKKDIYSDMKNVRVIQFDLNSPVNEKIKELCSGCEHYMEE